MSQINKLLMLATLFFTASQNMFAGVFYTNKVHFIEMLCKSANADGIKKSCFNSYYISLITDVPTALLPNESYLLIDFIHQLLITNSAIFETMLHNIRTKPELMVINAVLTEAKKQGNFDAQFQYVAEQAKIAFDVRNKKSCFSAMLDCIYNSFRKVKLAQN